MQGQLSYNAVQNTHILIVEPSHDLRVRIARAFQEQHFHLLAVGSGREALLMRRALGKEVLAIVELALPDMHGFDLAVRIQKMNTTSIIFTAYQADPHVVANALDQVAEDFIHKPLDTRELLARAFRVMVRKAHFLHQPPATTPSQSIAMV